MIDASASILTGGCLCGRVRYAVEISGTSAYLCHCRMCQRWMGSVSVAFTNVRKDAVRWDAPPDHYASSPIAVRGFCAVCGTSLTFEYPDSEMMDLTVGSFDDPGRFVPDHAFGIESRLDGWDDTRGLPGERADEHGALVARWQKLGRDVPE